MRSLLLSIIALVLLLPVSSNAQFFNDDVFDGWPLDSAVIRPGIDSLTMPATTLYNNGYFSVDTIGITLWQIGKSSKSFFADSTPVTGIMTDTVNSYPINANNSFTVHLFAGFNTIFDFYHRYQTTAGHDGGIVEFSIDSGVTWQNIRGGCSYGGGIKLDNVYAAEDTLQTGDAAFSGTSNGEMFSRVQFFTGYPVRTTGDSDCHFGFQPILVRFRFVSDSVADSLAGWIIDSVKLENDYYQGAVPQIKANFLQVYPNPSTDGLFIFPALTDETKYSLQVTSVLGKTLFVTPYNHRVDLSQYAKGIYFYKVTDGVISYTGKLITQ